MLLGAIASLLWKLSARLTRIDSKLDALGEEFKEHLRDHRPALRALSSTKTG